MKKYFALALLAGLALAQSGDPAELKVLSLFSRALLYQQQFTQIQKAAQDASDEYQKACEELVAKKGMPKGTTCAPNVDKQEVKLTAPVNKSVKPEDKK